MFLEILCFFSKDISKKSSQTQKLRHLPSSVVPLDEPQITPKGGQGGQLFDVCSQSTRNWSAGPRALAEISPHSTSAYFRLRIFCHEYNCGGSDHINLPVVCLESDCVWTCGLCCLNTMFNCIPPEELQTGITPIVSVIHT